MGRLILDSIRLEGFGSYLEPQVVEFGGQGPTAVVGSNGAGKSTLVSKALSWCLYGKCSPERMGSATKALAGKSVVCDAAKWAKVETRFSDGATLWAVLRSRKSNGKETVELRKLNGSEWESAGSDQAAVDAFVGAPYDVFVRTVVRGQNDVWNFAEATDARKREILDAVSGADALSGHYELAKSRAAILRPQLETLEARASDAERRGGIVASEIADVMGKAASWDRDHAVKVAQAQADLGRTEAEARQSTDPGLLSRYEAAKAAIQARCPVLDRRPYIDAVEAARVGWVAAQAEQRHAGAEHSRLKGLKPGQPCPVCQQTIPAEGATALAISVATHASADADQAEYHAKTQYAEAVRVQQEAEAWLTTARSQWQAELDALGPIPVQHGAWASALQESRNRLDDLQKTVNPWGAVVQSAQAQEDSLHREAVVFRELAAMVRHDLDRAEALVEALAPRGARSSLSQGALLAVEAAANQWLAVLSAGRISVEFPSERETQAGGTKTEITTQVWVQGPAGKVERDLLQLSGGERMRVNFAVDLGVAACFARGGVLALSLLVLDEAVFSGLDDAGKLAMATALHHAGVADVVVIDHDSRLSDALPRVIRVERGSDGWSHVVRE